MTIKLTPEDERYIREQVEAGRFPDEGAVVHAALRTLEIEDALLPSVPGEAAWTQETLRAAIQVGIDQADRGEFVESNAEDIMRRVDQQLERERTRSDQKAG